MMNLESVGLAALLLSFGASPVAYAQQEHQQPQQQGKGSQEQQQQTKSQPGQEDRKAQPDVQAQQALQPSRQARTQVAWQDRRAHNWQTEHRGWKERGGYAGYRIPDSRYRSFFGPEHAFRIGNYAVTMVDGFPRFYYSGYWFSVVDPWPETWANNWYGDDDVFLDYSGDGYYLYNRRYPGVRLAVVAYAA
jgi:hypothetical protein